MLSKVSQNFKQISLSKRPNFNNFRIFTIQKAVQNFSNAKTFESDSNIASTLKASDYLVKPLLLSILSACRSTDILV